MNTDGLIDRLNNCIMETKENIKAQKNSIISIHKYVDDMSQLNSTYNIGADMEAGHA